MTEGRSDEDEEVDIEGERRTSKGMARRKKAFMEASIKEVTRM